MSTQEGGREGGREVREGEGGREGGREGQGRGDGGISISLYIIQSSNVNTGGRDINIHIYNSVLKCQHRREGGREGGEGEREGGGGR